MERTPGCGGMTNPAKPSALFAGTAEPDQGRFFCSDGDRSTVEVWSGADRRSCRQRSGRSGYRRDAMRNSSVPLRWKGVPAAKQRGKASALLLPQAEPGAGGFKRTVGRKRQAERCSGVFRRLRKPRKSWSGWSANRWDTERKLSGSFVVVQRVAAKQHGVDSALFWGKRRKWGAVRRAAYFIRLRQKGDGPICT